jgi:hypothetical protein
MGLSTAA